MQSAVYIVWSDVNRVGIPIIDEQHRGIISSINSLHYFMQTGRGHEIIRPTMIIIKQYTLVHFKTEENLLSEAGYPELERHLLLHRALVNKTNRIAVGKNPKNDADTILRFLKQWWLNHINSEDRKYAPYLQKLLTSKNR